MDPNPGTMNGDPSSEIEKLGDFVRVSDTWRSSPRGGDRVGHRGWEEETECVDGDGDDKTLVGFFEREVSERIPDC